MSAGMSEMPRHHRSREAIRLGAATWRFARRLDGRCGDCGRCDGDDTRHRNGDCHLAEGWFAGEVSACPACFASRIRTEVGQTVAGEVVMRAARGDVEAVDLLGRSLSA